jgi:hypothetical protein
MFQIIDMYMTIEQIPQILGDDKFHPKKSEHWNKVRETMFVHTRGKNPEHILTQRRPNEDPDVQKYRLSIYEPITKGSMNRAIDKLFRIFQNANFSIQVSDELNTYLSEHKFDGQFFYSYIQKFVVRRMIEDPNGFLVWIPVGPGLTDPTVKVDVEPLLIMSDQIKYLDHNTITWIAEDERSMIRENGKMVEHGRVFYTLTTTGFFRHAQFGNSIDKKFDTVIIYQHDMGVCPAIILGGDLTDDHFFDSYFSAFVPFANEAIRQYSDWTAVMTTSAFPYREETAETCDAKGCRDGVVYNSDRDEHDTCSKCKGTGRVISRSPFGVFLREKGNAALGTDSGSSEPMVRFISPAVDIIKYSGEAWETLLKKAEESLHLSTIDEAQSGTAKQIDREDSFSQLTKISNNLFDEIIFKSLVFIEKYRNVTNPMDPVIVKPISFSMKTENDLIDELNKLTDKNAPIAFLVESTKDLARKRFSGNKSVSRMVEILVSFDPIYHLNTKDKQMLLASGTIRKEDLLKSLFAYKTLTAMVADNGTEFLEKPLSVIFAELDARLAPIIATYIPKTVIDINSDSVETGTADTELARQRAEAQANLKGTVGGVQGILSIQQSVSQGVTKRDAAISLLETIYGFDSETANRLLGDPIETPPTA